MTARQKRKPLTIEQMERINDLSARAAQRVSDRLSQLAILATDANAAKRRARCVCQACEYLNVGRLAGQAFTAWNCRLCREPQPSHPNTAVPALCAGCAEAFELCVECGGDREMRHRRRLTGRRPKKVVNT